MAETLPISIPIPQESAIATYDWIDIASGVGYKDFYGFEYSTNGSTLSYGFITNEIYSNRISVVDTAGTISRTFQFTCFRPLTISGNAYLFIPVGNQKSTTDETQTIVAKLYKNTTQLGGTYSRNITASNTTPQGDSVLANFVVPLTLFGKDDVIKVEITISGCTHSWICHDPKNRSNGFTAGSTISQLTLSLPIKLEL